MDDVGYWSGADNAVDDFLQGRTDFKREQHARLHLVNNDISQLEPPLPRPVCRRRRCRLPENALMLDAGAGKCPYKHHFAHARYSPQISANRAGIRANHLRLRPYVR